VGREVAKADLDRDGLRVQPLGAESSTDLVGLDEQPRLDLGERCRVLGEGLLLADGLRGAVDLDLAAGTTPADAMRAALELAPMRSVGLRRMNLDDLFVELVSGPESGGAARKGAKIDA